MKSYFILLLWALFEFGTSKQTAVRPRQSASVEYFTKRSQAITINIMFHMDPVLSTKLAKQYGSSTRSKLKILSRNILKDVGRLFLHPSLNQTIRFKLLDTKFIRKSKNSVNLDENASSYLKTYCDWQTKKKISMKKLYFSVLLTGLDLFYVNSRGEPVRRSTGRSYMTSMCTVKKSCTLIEWNPKNIAFLLAHEIAHSLSIGHDGAPSNQCAGNYVMSSKYSDRSHPRTWSKCSLQTLKRYLQSDKSWCLRTDY